MDELGNQRKGFIDLFPPQGEMRPAKYETNNQFSYDKCGDSQYVTGGSLLAALPEECDAGERSSTNLHLSFDYPCEIFVLSLLSVNDTDLQDQAVGHNEGGGKQTKFTKWWSRW